MNQVTTNNGKTLLFIAAQQRYLSVVWLLLDRGAGVNQARTTDGITPLFNAAQQGHVSAVQLLLD